MFALTTLVYPVTLAVLCLGTGLLVERVSNLSLPGVLLPAIGAAALIVASQLSTYVVWLAPATPYFMLALALGGMVAGWERFAGWTRRWQAHVGDGLVFLVAYAVALAPVLAAGRPTFTAYGTLADSAFHMMGADFLIHHGQDYSHLDLRNSYGGFIESYYGTGYPSGADTLFGASASLLGLPLIWIFQPFNAFMLATAAGPALVLARRAGLAGVWAALAALTMTLPALVYAYELIGSIKEIVALPLILCAGALAVAERRWMDAGPRGAIPLALVFAGGVSALGVAFGAWALTAVVVLAIVAFVQIAHRTLDVRQLLGLIGVGALVVLIGALPTWSHLGASLQVAKTIASTANPGNLHTPLRAAQLLGVWFGATYTESAAGPALALNNAAIGLAMIVGVVGITWLLYRRRFALVGWVCLMLVLWLALDAFASTWANAKTLMLTSSVVVLMVWAGIAAIWRSRARLLAPTFAFLLTVGVLASDALQYHSTNLAPTARYEELASVGSRFAGQGPALVTDFDEYSMYELRALDVGGPDFAYAPPSLRAVAHGYGRPVDLGRAGPSTLDPYPLIVTRRDPSAHRPPKSYSLAWQGVYYQVWRLGRQSSAAPTSADLPQPITVSIEHARRPRTWVLSRKLIFMKGGGTLRARFTLPHSGGWAVWIKGDVMRPIAIAVDGRKLGAIAEQLDGNTVVVNALTPLRTRLAAGPHALTVTRSGDGLAPGDGGAAVLASIFLVPEEGV